MFLCNHLFCEECCSTFVESKLKEMELFTCPDCKADYDPDSVFFMSLSGEEQQKLALINERRRIALLSKLKNCPTPNCEYGTISRQESGRGRCNQCLKEYCFSCLGLPHSGNCNDHMANILKKDFNYQRCPKCKNMVEKIKGCVHMTCKCKAEFCYNCGRQWRSNSHVC